MNQQRQEIPIDNVGTVLQQLVQACKSGDPGLENMRCAYILKEDSLIHVYNIFDLLDNLVKKPLDLNTVEKFYIYRPLSES